MWQGMMAMLVARMRVAQFTVTMARIIWRMKMSRVIITTTVMSRVTMAVAVGSLVAVSFIPSSSFVISMATVTSIALRALSFLNLPDLKF